MMAAEGVEVEMVSVLARAREVVQEMLEIVVSEVVLKLKTSVIAKITE